MAPGRALSPFVLWSDPLLVATLFDSGVRQGRNNARLVDHTRHMLSVQSGPFKSCCSCQAACT